MTQIIAMPEVVRPTTTPLKSSVLDHATLGPEIASIGLRNDEGLWPSYNCLGNADIVPNCGPHPKTYNYAGWTPSFLFSGHLGVRCGAVGLDREDMTSEVQRVFKANQGRLIEQALAEYRFSDASPDGYWDAAEDVLPGEQPSILVAFAVLEGNAAREYAGVPTIHMPRAAATILEGAGVIVWDGDKAYSKNGSKIAMGGGYDIATDFTDGTLTMYATGEVYVEMGRLIHHDAVVIPGSIPDPGSDTSALGDNDVIAMAERQFRVAVDCFAQQVTGTLF